VKKIGNKTAHFQELETLLNGAETREEAIEVLTAYAQEQERILNTGRMTVPKRRKIARKIRTARALLRGLLSPSALGPRKRKPGKAAIASYLEKRAALLRQLGLENGAKNVD
jgi:hypothetical protein